MQAGTSIGHYDLLSALGRGGMGEVWRAHDTKLHRDVALKTLPPEFAREPERAARFEREATLLAALNHPNIAAIHGVEEHVGARFLVLELVEGSTLAERLHSGPLPVEESLRLAVQIAEALEAAHDRGVIHRDLKPANIKVTPEGRVKVLDFGLAKALTPTTHDVATETALGTKLGTVMGTAPYMSPEQARGAAVNRQTDIWSFGVVLYEMLTGASPFAGDTSTEILARVLKTPPDFALLPPDTPPSARRLLRRCLEKDQKRRSQHIGDVRLELEEALTELAAEPRSDTASAASTNGGSRRAAGALVVVAAVALAGFGGWVIATRSVAEAPAGVVRLSIPSLERPTLWPFGTRHIAISDDGSRVAYAGANGLVIRQLHDDATVTVAKYATMNPFFSPTGDKVGFFADPGALYSVPSAGGTPTLLVATPERTSGATWGPGGTIVFANTEGLYRVAESGGEPELLKKPDPLRKERLYASPQFMPDGQSVLFTVISESSNEAMQIASLDLKTLEFKIVLSGGSAPRYAPTGHLLYASGQALNAIGFDLDRLETRGSPVAIAGAAIASALDNGAAEFAVSTNGTLLFLAPTTTVAPNLRTFSWMDRQGVEERLQLEPGSYGDPQISPDGTRVALDMFGNGNRDVWIWNLERQSLTRLTTNSTEDLLPLWSVDNRRVFFASNRAGTLDIYSQAADGATEARVEFAGDGVQLPSSFTPDGARLLVYENFRDLNVLNLARPERLEPLLDGPFDERLGAVSPDGHWIAYESDESGAQIEIFLRPFPDVGARREKISIAGGRYPRWSRQGRDELFYVGLDGAMMAASVRLSPNLVLGPVTKLFDWIRPPPIRSGSPYDVSPIDGRFLMLNVPVGTGSVDIPVVLNWFNELRAQAPLR